MSDDRNEYDEIPVHYCRRCLSLKVLIDTEFGDYCGDCGSTDIGQIQIEEWETLQKEQLKLQQQVWQRKQRKK